jgi:hypothetical protein
VPQKELPSGVGAHYDWIIKKVAQHLKGYGMQIYMRAGHLQHCAPMWEHTPPMLDLLST